MKTKSPKTEEIIVKILERDYPLTAGEIRKKAIQNFTLSYSVSGIQTALRNLREQHQIHKSGPRYSLNVQTLIDKRDNIQNTIERYTQAQSYHLFHQEETHYFFRTPQELDLFWNAIAKKWFAFYPPQSDSYLQFQPFPWFALTHLDQEKKIIDSYGAHCETVETLMLQNHYQSDFQGLYSNENLKLWTTKDFDSFSGAFGLYQDHTIEFHFPSEFRQAIKDFLTLEQTFNFKSIQPFFAEGNYELIISKNRKKAEKLKKLFYKMKE